MNCSQLLVAVPRVLARWSLDAQGLSRVMRRMLIIMTASGALCVHQTSALRCVVLRNPRLRSGYFQARSRAERGVAARGDPYRGEGKAPRRATFMQNSKQHKHCVVESRRPKAPIPATVGRECSTVRHPQRLGLSVRSNARPPTSQWESGQTAALRASTRAPRRARRSLAPPRPDIWREASLAPPRPDI